MTKPELVQERPIQLAELKSELEKVQKRDTELSFRGGKTIEYLNECESLSIKKSKELMEKLRALEIPRIQDNHLIKICNILPVTVKEVQTVLQGYTVSVTKENLEKLAKTVAEYA